MTSIAEVIAWEALDSRGNPTVACEVHLTGGGVGRALAPSGASTGAHEAHELRDGGDRYGGNGVLKAVANANGPLAQAVVGLDATDQRSVDEALRNCDGTENLGRLGANAVLAISLATVIATANEVGEPLYRFVLDDETQPLLPMPMINIISGGAHAARAVDIQDVLVVPNGASVMAEAIEWVWRTRRATAEVLEEAGYLTALVADEGGLGPALPSNVAAIQAVAQGIERAGLQLGHEVSIALDVAANQFLEPDGSYRFRAEDRVLDAAELVAEQASWCDRFPIVSIEDALSEDDWDGWKLATDVLGERVQLLGDDLFVTNGQRLQRGILDGIANAVLVKPNQIGSVTDARDVVRQAHEAGYATVLSARSGETEDDWLADLATGWRTGQIKVGSTMRSERTAKWNRLLRIAADLGDIALASEPRRRAPGPA